MSDLYWKEAWTWPSKKFNSYCGRLGKKSNPGKRGEEQNKLDFNDGKCLVKEDFLFLNG